MFGLFGGGGGVGFLFNGLWGIGVIGGVDFDSSDDEMNMCFGVGGIVGMMFIFVVFLVGFFNFFGFYNDGFGGIGGVIF